MKLSETAIEQLSSSASRMRIALAVGLTEPWIKKGIKENRNDGFLTKAYVIKAIKQETGLSEEEILTESVTEVVQS